MERKVSIGVLGGVRRNSLVASPGCGQGRKSWLLQGTVLGPTAPRDLVGPIAGAQHYSDHEAT